MVSHSIATLRFLRVDERSCFSSALRLQGHRSDEGLLMLLSQVVVSSICYGVANIRKKLQVIIVAGMG